MSETIDIRDNDELNRALALAQHTVYKRYLSELHEYPLVQPTERFLDEKAEDCVRFFQLERLTCKKGEDIFQKLSTVYYASMSLGCNLIVMVDVEQNNAPTKIYLGVRNSGEDITKLGTSFRALKNGIKSNFPGTRFHDLSSREEMPKLIEDIFGDQAKYISAVSCVAAVRDKTKTEHKTFIQGLERFIDAMKGTAYTAVFIAEPIKPEEQMAIRSGYENLYSTLSSFRKSIWSYQENESLSVMESLSLGISKSVTEGISQTQSHTVNAGVNMGISFSKNNSNGSSFTESSSSSAPTIASKAGQVLSSTPNLFAIVGKAGKVFSSVNPVAGTILRLIVSETLKGGSISETNTRATVENIGKTFGLNGGFNTSYARTTGESVSKAEIKTKSETKTSGKTTTTGSGKTLQIEMTNKPIEEMLAKTESQLKRVQEGEDYGTYSCGAYFLSGKQENSLLAANTYRALMIGDGSSVESGAVNFWNGNNEDKDKIGAIKEYLKRFVHPVFVMPIAEEPNDFSDFIPYTAGTIVSGLELPLHLGLPTRSVYGLPVLEHAEFGRNVEKGAEQTTQKNPEINIGTIFHMGQKEENASVMLDIQELTAHTFITGSTGSGKSNTIYQILQKLMEQQMKFLVVEPAKGEYKTIFGSRKDVAVYGTNPKISGMEMLHINPFRFPSTVHVLEHMDRLVEIFNVCWPMYAAMPAILKDSIERAYKVAGWDLETSENLYDEQIYPSFADVLVQIKTVLQESEYSEDNKGDYTGSLSTRIRSLTNGINGMIFCADEIQDKQLFDENVIVDLSRIGSTETKALIMGILILKLQEYRMDSCKPNASLHHITVLEEAHNLLRRTSQEQSSEGSNLLGKSVEMLANSIAEMRTYGEGFIIADQSPGLLDMSVIRNTNTKIVLKLPDFSDRELVGRASGLNEEQIAELAKLDKGVAAVMQSGWLESVLCQVDKFEQDNFAELKRPVVSIEKKVNTNSLKRSLLECIMNQEIYRKGDRVDIRKLKNEVLKSDLTAVIKVSYLHYIEAKEDQMVMALIKLIYEFFEAEQVMECSKLCKSIEDMNNYIIAHLHPSINGYGQLAIDMILMYLVNEKAERDLSFNEIRLNFMQKYVK